MKVCYFGDSITEGFEALKNHKNVVNMGISGNKINNLIGRFQDLILENPDRLIIMIGINDFLDSNQYWGTPIKLDIPLMYNILLKMIEDNFPDLEVYLCSILPISIGLEQDQLLDYNHKIIDLNEDIKLLASVYGYEYLDLHQHFKSEDDILNYDFTEDGVHLNSKGYELYYQLIKELLVES